MRFSWENFGTAFLKEVIRVTDNIDNKDLYMATDDLQALIGCMNTICDMPDRNFVMKYRQIIEHYVLSYYPDEIKKICAADNIVDRNFNKKQEKMGIVK